MLNVRRKTKEMAHALLSQVFAFTVLTLAAVGAWRDAWSIVLSSSTRAGIPDSISVAFENQGRVPVRGIGLVLSLYLDDELYGWAFDPDLRSRPIALKPGQRRTITIPWSSLSFTDIRGNPISASTVSEAMSIGHWDLILTINDLDTPKPSHESNLTVWSNTLGLRPPP